MNAPTGSPTQQQITPAGCASLVVVALLIAAIVGLVMKYGVPGIILSVLSVLAMLVGAMGAVGANAVMKTDHAKKRVTAAGHYTCALIGIGSAVVAMGMALSIEACVDIPVKLAGGGAGLALVVFAAGAAFFRVTSKTAS